MAEEQKKKAVKYQTTHKKNTENCLWNVFITSISTCQRYLYKTWSNWCTIQFLVSSKPDQCSWNQFPIEIEWHGMSKLCQDRTSIQAHVIMTDHVVTLAVLSLIT